MCVYIYIHTFYFSVLLGKCDLSGNLPAISTEKMLREMIHDSTPRTCAFPAFGIPGIRFV